MIFAEPERGRHTHTHRDKQVQLISTCSLTRSSPAPKLEPTRPGNLHYARSTFQLWQLETDIQRNRENLHPSTPTAYKPTAGFRSSTVQVLPLTSATHDCLILGSASLLRGHLLGIWGCAKRIPGGHRHGMTTPEYQDGSGEAPLTRLLSSTWGRLGVHTLRSQGSD